MTSWASPSPPEAALGRHHRSRTASLLGRNGPNALVAVTDAYYNASIVLPMNLRTGKSPVKSDQPIQSTTLNCRPSSASAVVCASPDNTVIAWDVKANKRLWSLPTTARRAPLVTNVTDGLIFGFLDETSVVLDAKTGKDLVTNAGAAPTDVNADGGVYTYMGVAFDVPVYGSTPSSSETSSGVRADLGVRADVGLLYLLNPNRATPSRRSSRPTRRRSSRRMTRGLRTTAVALIVAAASLLPGPSQARDTTAPAPLVWQTDVADPAVVRSNSGWVALATGAYIPGFVPRAAPVRSPVSAPRSPRLRRGCCLAGSGRPTSSVRLSVGCSITPLALRESRAAAGASAWRSGLRRPVRSHAPRGTYPVCPPRVGWPSAEDELADKEHFLPAGGAIDPSVFQEKDGRLFLL